MRKNDGKLDEVVAKVEGKVVKTRHYIIDKKLRYMVVSSNGRKVLWKAGNITPEKAIECYRRHLKQEAVARREAEWAREHQREVLYSEWKEQRATWARTARRDGLRAKVLSGAFEILTRYILPLYSLRNRYILTDGDCPFTRADGTPSPSMAYYLRRMESLIKKFSGVLNVDFKGEDLQGVCRTIIELEHPFRQWLLDSYEGMSDDAEEESIERELIGNPTLMLYLTYTFMTRAFEVKRKEIDNPDANTLKAMRGCLRLESMDGGLAGLDLADLFMRHDWEDIFAAFAGLYARVQSLYHKEYLPAALARYTQSSRHYARLAAAFREEEIPEMDRLLTEAVKDASAKGVNFSKMRQKSVELD